MFTISQSSELEPLQHFFPIHNFLSSAKTSLQYFNVSTKQILQSRLKPLYSIHLSIHTAFCSMAQYTYYHTNIIYESMKYMNFSHATFPPPLSTPPLACNLSLSPPPNPRSHASLSDTYPLVARRQEEGLGFRV